MKNIRWLHLSDFHCGKDNYGQRRLFNYILEHMKEEKVKNFIPDMIFLTGDLAYLGLKEQYDDFLNGFLIRILDIYDKAPLIYTVPGNHDVNRDKAPMAAASLYNVVQNNPAFFDADIRGLERRREIFERFSGFYNSDIETFCQPVRGIFEEKASYHEMIQLDGVRIGIAGINTSWLSMSKSDKEQLTPGKYPVEEVLTAMKDCDYRLVLGHHPLSWFENSQRQQITSLFAKHKVIYLHGHLHKNSNEYAFSADTGFLNIQSGASFQAREDEIYYNSLLWGELDAQADTVKLMPRKWSSREQKFVLDASDYLPGAFRREGTDYWEFPVTCRITGKSKQEKLKEKLPVGWHLIERDHIQKKRKQRLDDDDILKFFDGKEPTYEVILSKKIPIRQVTAEIADDFEKAAEKEQLRCTVIVGAGGEG